MTAAPIIPESVDPARFSRRRALTVLGAGLGGAAILAACGSDSTSAAVNGDLTATPAETGGPFPADGSNEDGGGSIVNILTDSRSVRSDITADLDGSNVQEGVPFTLTTTVVDGAGAPLAGAAVYIWHCSREGIYSEYNSAMIGGDFTDRSFLRGVQITDDAGNVTFTSILPGRYKGRAFHIHFEVYSDSSYGSLLLTSQMGMDDDLVTSLYAEASGYETALANVTLNGSDNIFSDGFDHQLLTVSGDVTAGLASTFTAVV